MRTTLGAAAWAAVGEAKQDGPVGHPLQEAWTISVAVQGHQQAFRLMACPQHSKADGPILLP